MRARAVVAAALATVVLGACEKPQTTQSSAKKSDSRAYEGAQPPYMAPGWKAGDNRSWNEQMRLRVQNQNEYNRTQ